MVADDHMQIAKAARIHMVADDRTHIAAGITAALLSLLMVLVLSVSVAFAAGDNADEGDILKPQHGIPLVIVNIDESEEAIEAANKSAEEQGKSHKYGTIEDMNSSENHSVRCVGSVQIKVPDGYKLSGDDLTWIGSDLKMDYIRGRGNSTWDNPKKPYKIQLSEKANLFGMGKSKDWALMANYYDNTVMRNRLTYWLGAKLGMPYSVESLPVDFVMTGADGAKYLGVYDLSETVKIEKSRVNIDKLDTEPEDASAAGDKEYQKTGGYLFSIFSPLQKDDPESNTFTTKNGVEFHFNNPEFLDEDGLTEWQKEQRTYLINNVQEIENLIVDSEEIDQATHDKIAEMLDLKSVADYWLMQELTRNGDAYGTGSTYFFKKRGGKMYFGPLWDFDLAWGKIYENADSDDNDDVDGFNHTHMLWADELRAKDPEFVSLINEEWAKLEPALTEITKSGGIMDQYKAEVREAYNADPEMALWDDNDLDANTETLRRWTDARHEWMENNKDKFGAVYAKVSYIADGETIYVEEKARVGYNPSDNPEAPEKDGFYFAGWYSEDGTPMIDVKVEGDMNLYAKYVAEKDAVLPTDVYLENYEMWEEAGMSSFLADCCEVLPSDAISTKVTWSSSDEDIASVDSAGELSAHKPGDVTLTATAINGVKATLVLHVVEEGKLEWKRPEGIAMDESEIRLKTGGYTQAKWHLLPEGEPVKQSYSEYVVSDEEVVSVDSLGVITAIGPGTADVKLKVFSDDEEPITTNFKVIVSDKEDSSDAADKEAEEKAKAEAEAARKAAEEAAVAVGTEHKAGGSNYRITKKASGSKAGTVALKKAANRKSVKIPATVTIKGRKFKVTRIDARAFKGSKIRTVTIGKNVKTIKKNAFTGSKAVKLIIKSKKLTKKSIKGSLKGSKVRTVQIKVGKKALNRKYFRKYRKIFIPKNTGKKVRIRL